MKDRHGCACQQCGCSSISSVPGQPCPSCSAGAHRPSEAVQLHLRAGLEHWIRLMPISLGSSGLSDKQLDLAGKAWWAWHGKSHCPIKRPAAKTGGD